MDIKARERRKLSIRKKAVGTKNRPRLNVFRSSKHIYAALVDDTAGRTIISVRETDLKKAAATKTDKAFLVGRLIGEKALKKGFKKVVFDRAGYLYHGRVKKLAEGAREAGLDF
ncbi:MAG: 50S ribosomal protein L18 [Candidatus Woykebacteria bacterium GWB1_45_5]|uniref:Large ribosomal subunit protein uL18 n=2 Tax=Candidatus Woykeibacteriota TaxID=1817899 RepID=A0A1G1W2J8_9BACT|nr:MAG: 50S ribosomal protein L18 [Candidatus Woykebacteria bacterium GWA1_44_8]OGY23317.1 MAG: 50S ribosomal protein L18 [Candidatus Woykebacteria bacterium GWB1_45_5]